MGEKFKFCNDLFVAKIGGPNEYQLFGKSDEAGRQRLCLRCCLVGLGGGVPLEKLIFRDLEVILHVWNQS